MPRNIVLLSDGTGNSAGKLFKTNVWRVYQALDLRHANQIAFYDDGVGTSSIKPLAWVGGAFGWGLKRNIIALYMFLCRNYSLGDQIFGFGFSRGAFTIRVLIRFVLAKGLITNFDSDDDLRRKARKLYRDFRAEQDSALTPSKLVRSLAYAIVRSFEPTDIEVSHVDNIQFLGLWDTVDAYGMPIEELKVGIDRYIWPLSLNDPELDPRIRKACHALAIDDRRTSFHPLLWDERNRPQVPHTDHEQLTQVWFAGAHANIGGGYPDDGMAMVPLRWMVHNASRHGLIFQPLAVEEIELGAAPFGRLYNSRAGLGAYYRYQPRRLDPPQDRQGACIPSPKIHESVIWRMAAGNDVYAPFNLPRDFNVVQDDQAEVNVYDFATCKDVVAPTANLFDFGAPAGPNSDSELKARIAEGMQILQRPDAGALELTWDTVWWRRLISMATFVATGALIVHPFIELPKAPPFLTSVIMPFRWMHPIRDFFLAIGSTIEPAVRGTINLASSLLPGFATEWLRVYRAAPWMVALWGLVVVLLLLWGALIDRRIADRARAAWNPQWRSQRRAWMRRSVPRRIAFGVCAAIVFGGYFFFWSTALAQLAYYLWWPGDMQVLGDNMTAADRLATFDYWRIYLIWLIPGTLVLGMLFVTTARWILTTWRLRTQLSAQSGELPGLALWIARRSSRSPITSGLQQGIRHLIPAAFALALLVCATALVSAFTFSLMNTGGWVCQPEGTLHGMQVGQKKEVPFRFDSGCQSTKIFLDPGATYRLDIENVSYPGRGVAVGRLHDDERPFGDWVPPKPGIRTQLLALPFRRNLTAPWFQPIVQVGRLGRAQYVLDRSVASSDVVRAVRKTPEGDEQTIGVKIASDTNEIKVPSLKYSDDDTELFIFVNDAVVGIPRLWNWFYRGNNGEGTLIITKIAEPPQKRPH